MFKMFTPCCCPKDPNTLNQEENQAVLELMRLIFKLVKEITTMPTGVELKQKLNALKKLQQNPAYNLLPKETACYYFNNLIDCIAKLNQYNNAINDINSLLAYIEDYQPKLKYSDDVIALQQQELELLSARITNRPIASAPPALGELEEKTDVSTILVKPLNNELNDVPPDLKLLKTLSQQTLIAKLYIQEGDIQRILGRHKQEQYNAAEKTYNTMAIQIYSLEFLVERLNTTTYIAEKNMLLNLIYRHLEAKENIIWAKRLQIEYSNNENFHVKTNQALEAFLVLCLKYQAKNPEKLNASVQFNLALAKLYFLQADIYKNTKSYSTHLDKALGYAKQAYEIKQKQIDIEKELAKHPVIELKVTLQYAMLLTTTNLPDNWRLAIKLLDTEIGKNSTERRLYKAKIIALRKLNKLQAAIDVCDEVLTFAKTDAPILLLKAEMLVDLLKTIDNPEKKALYKHQLLSIVKSLSNVLTPESRELNAALDLIKNIMPLINSDNYIIVADIDDEKKMPAPNQDTNLITQLWNDLKRQNFNNTIINLGKFIKNPLSTRFLQDKLFPTNDNPGSFCMLDLAFELVKFARFHNNDWKTHQQVTRLVRDALKLIAQAWKKLEINLAKIPLQLLIRHFCQAARYVLPNAKPKKHSQFYQPLCIMAPTNDLTQEEIMKSIQQTHTDKMFDLKAYQTQLRNQMGLLNFYQYAELLSGEKHTTPIENMVQVLQKPYQNHSQKQINLFINDITYIAKGGTLFDQDCPSMEEVLAIFHFLNHCQYMHRNKMAEPINNIITQVISQLEKTQQLLPTRITLAKYAENRANAANYFPLKNKPNPYRSTQRVPYEDLLTRQLRERNEAIRIQEQMTERPNYGSGGHC